MQAQERKNEDILSQEKRRPPTEGPLGGTLFGGLKSGKQRQTMFS